MTALAYAGLVAVALGLLLFAKLILKRPVDHDSGPPPGQTYPWWDKWSLWHLVGSFLLGFASCMLGVRPLWAIVITVIAGIGWEIIAGYVDRGDILWDALGAVGGAAVCVLVFA